MSEKLLVENMEALMKAFKELKESQNQNYKVQILLLKVWRKRKKSFLKLHNLSRPWISARRNLLVSMKL